MADSISDSAKYDLTNYNTTEYDPAKYNLTNYDTKKYDLIRAEINIPNQRDPMMVSLRKRKKYKLLFLYATLKVIEVQKLKETKPLSLTTVKKLVELKRQNSMVRRFKATATYGNVWKLFFIVLLFGLGVVWVATYPEHFNGLKKPNSEEYIEASDRWAAGFYFMTTTTSSVGYGDISPATSNARIACGCYQLFVWGLSVATLFNIDFNVVRPLEILKYPFVEFGKIIGIVKSRQTQVLPVV